MTTAPEQHAPTGNEKMMAAAMHVATIPAPIVAPLVGLAVARRSRYVTAHALQALYETLVLNVVLGVLMLCSFAYTLSRLWTLYQNDWQGFNLIEFIARFLIGWLLLALLAFVNSIISLRQAWKAGMGQWPKHGRVVRAVHRRFPNDPRASTLGPPSLQPFPFSSNPDPTSTAEREPLRQPR